MSERYNGHANWETWNVLLWADNERPLQAATRRFARTSPDAKACRVFFFEMFPKGTPDMDHVSEMALVDWSCVADNLRDWE